MFVTPSEAKDLLLLVAARTVGHGFSRVNSRNNRYGALAPEVRMAASLDSTNPAQPSEVQG